MDKEEYASVPWCFLPSVLEASSSVSTHIYSVIDVMLLPCTVFESPRTPKHQGFMGILCSWNFKNGMCDWGIKNNRRAYRDISSARTHDPLSHWISCSKHKFKDKTLKNFKVAAAEH